MAETSRRLLRLLSLLQAPREWPGPELARRLEVSQRTVRNDVERLRRLGYPVEANRGPVGGYRLAAGSAMPPLILEDDEAVAVAVALRTATDGGVIGLEDTVQAALGKLNQVLPKRLAARVEALQANVVRVSPGAGRRRGPEVDTALLALISGAIQDGEVLRFGYADHSGVQSERRVEPARLVNLGRRWYLVAFDKASADWRIFRLDRIREARSVLHRFRHRPLPADDLGHYVAARTRQVQQRVVGTVVVDAPADRVAASMGGWIVGAVEPLDPARCRISLGGRSADEMAIWLGLLRADFTVEPGSPGLADAVRQLSDRYQRAASPDRNTPEPPATTGASRHRNGCG
jgi:predicted DNA-binding transcriptional regulator YafY